MDYKDLDRAILEHFADFDAHETVRRFEDSETGLIAFIAIHNTNLGPALGGCRMYPYKSEDEAIKDVLRLSKGMTYKNALAGLPLGGGKSVIIGNARSAKTEQLIAMMGRAVDSLGGRYITAEDSGTNVNDMAIMARHTDYVMGRPVDGSKIGGDPSPFTAFGVFSGIEAACLKKYGTKDLNGKTIAVQGLGAVGYDLCRRLDKAGAALIVTDIQDEALKKAQSEFSDISVVAPDDIFATKADIFAPCAMGAAINNKTLPQLQVDIVAGAANNQLATKATEEALTESDILYAPDYAINAGGVIAVCYEYLQQTGTNPLGHDLTRENMMAHIGDIAKTLQKIFDIAEEQGTSTAAAADELAENIFLNAEKKRAIA